MQQQFTEKAIRFLDSLSDKDRERIIRKIRWFISQKNFIRFAKLLKSLAPATHRFRIGMYRVLFAYNSSEEIMIIYDIDKRSDIYRK